MRMRLLLAAGVLSFVPAFVRAQDVPATAPVQEPPATAAAHRGGSFEFSLSGGFSLLDEGFYEYFSTNTTRVVNASSGREMIGGQLRATYNFSPHLGFGAGIGIANGVKFASDNGALLLLAPFGALTYTFGLNRRFSPFIEVGGGLTQVHAYTGSLFPSAGDGKTKAFSVFGGLGFRAMLSSALALRAEGRMAFDSFPDAPKRSSNVTVNLGFSYFLGGGPPRDTDGDGVRDGKDRCPGTPSAAWVYDDGCVIDSDNDGVADGLDQCADTPAGVTVNESGCPVDNDGDGIADHLDRCANTPADARPVGADGCPTDADSDGVFDYLDRCANSPAGIPVDANGCPFDTDNDGVTDNLDRCADTPVNARPVHPAGHAQAGCPVDSDADRVPDYLDRCANTAAGTQVDANGCPVARDADGDGVIDASDRCRNTPAGSRVDATGCPLAEPTEPPAPGVLPEVGQSLVLSAVRFAANGSLTAGSRRALDGIAAAIGAIPDSRWEIGGYTTSSVGTRAGTQRRALAVAQYLIRWGGVASSALTYVGYGRTNPRQTQRVEIKRIQ